MFACLPLRGGVVIRSVALSLVVSCSLACLIGFNPKQPPAPKRAHGSQHRVGTGESQADDKVLWVSLAVPEDDVRVAEQQVSCARAPQDRRDIPPLQRARERLHLFGFHDKFIW